MKEYCGVPAGALHFYIPHIKNAIRRIKRGQRFVTDIELKALAQVFGVGVDELI